MSALDPAALEAAAMRTNPYGPFEKEWEAQTGYIWGTKPHADRMNHDRRVAFYRTWHTAAYLSVQEQPRPSGEQEVAEGC